MSDAAIIILTGSVVAINCSLLGSYLVLRKMSMISDAISHAVLPGLVIGYFFGGAQVPMINFIGAASAGVFATLMIEFLSKKGKLQNDASIGLTFTCLFAVGVLLVTHLGRRTHIDQDCLLYGDIAYVPLDTVDIAGFDSVPRALPILGFVTILIVGFIFLNYRKLLITSFDPDYSNAIGISSQFWHYLIMIITSLATVTAFESVGAILIVALFIGPPACAYLFCQDLKRMLLISCLYGVGAAALGYALAAYLDGSIAGAMAILVGVEFFFTYLILKISGRFGRKKVLLSSAEV